MADEQVSGALGIDLASVRQAFVDIQTKQVALVKEAARADKRLDAAVLRIKRTQFEIKDLENRSASLFKKMGKRFGRFAIADALGTSLDGYIERSTLGSGVKGFVRVGLNAGEGLIEGGFAGLIIKSTIGLLNMQREYKEELKRARELDQKRADALNEKLRAIADAARRDFFDLAAHQRELLEANEEKTKDLLYRTWQVVGA